VTSETLRELVEEVAALQRWEGEGGSSCDRFDVIAKIQAQLSIFAEPAQRLGIAKTCIKA